MNTLFMVRSNAKPGQEEAYNHWYNNVHLAEVLSIDGFKSAQRFALHDTQIQADQPHGYLALYEISTDEVAATMTRLGEATWLNMSDAIDPESIQISLFAETTAKMLADN
jgi:hypothetical protein